VDNLLGITISFVVLLLEAFDGDNGHE
jgi:hypothetical protein